MYVQTVTIAYYQHCTYYYTMYIAMSMISQAVESSCQSFATSATLLLGHVSPADTMSQDRGSAASSVCVSPVLCVSQMIDTCRYLALCVERLCLSVQVSVMHTLHI